MINWKKIKLIVFDFDLTLTCIHTSGCQNERHLEEDNIIQNISDFRLIKILIPSLIEMGYHVSIASYADNSLHNEDKGYIAGEYLIMKYLNVLYPIDRNFLNKEDIIGFYPSSDLDGKNLHIDRLIIRYNKLYPNNPITSPDQILLIDDQENNIKIAKFRGHQVYQIKDLHGLNREEWFEYISPEIKSCGLSDLVKQNFDIDYKKDHEDSDNEF